MPSDFLWKLRLRYGLLKTPFQHFVVIAEGLPDRASPELKGFLSVKVWASSSDEALTIAKDMAGEMAFLVDGRAYFYDAPPTEAPGRACVGYDARIYTYPANKLDD